VEVLICLFLFAAIFLIASYFSHKGRKFDYLSPQLKKEIQEKKRNQGFAPPAQLVQILKPLNRPILRRLGGEENVKQKLLAAEINITPESFLFIKEMLVIILPLGLYFLLGTKLVKPMWLIVAGLIGFFLPDLHLKNRLHKRKQEVVKYLPDAIDLLSLCVSGGLDFITGIKWVIQRSKPTGLVKEFSLLFQELETGRSKPEAFRSMAKRLDVPEVYSFVRTIVQADKMGVSIGETLSILSDEMRRQRFQRGERMALKAPIKMLFPLIVFILPVIGIIVGAPVVMQFLQQGALKAAIMR
jgi:tight adherence protein C